MRLIEKIILLLLGISLFPLLVTGGLLFLSVQNSIGDQTRNNLNSIATIQEHRLANIRVQNLELLKNFTDQPQLKTLVNQYSRTHSNRDRDQLTFILDVTRKTAAHVERITIMDPSGNVVTSTDRKLNGADFSTNELFKLGRGGNDTKLVSRGSDRHTVFYVSGPLILNGQTIGIAGIEVDDMELLSTVRDYTGLGETGEITLAQRLPDGRVSYVTPLRFDGNAAFKRTAGPKLPAYKALMGQETTFNDIRDYRGKSVLAVSRYIKDSQWGLVVKIDRSEAFQPSSQLKSEFLLLAFISSVLVVFTAIALAQRVTQPILDIDEVAEEVSHGKLDDRVQDIASDEMGHLATNFNNMLDNLEQLDKAKSDFLSLASHQLRTPLTSVKWYAEALIDPDSGLNKTKQKHYLRQLHASNERMIELVNALLNVSKIDFGSLPFKADPVQLDSALDQVINDLSTRIRDKEIVLERNVDEKIAPIYIDRAWARIILQNLISNAIKYSEPKQHVEVTIEQLPAQVLITVKDHGYGIPAAQQNKVFTKFFRADNAKQIGSDGSGLGMYITKAMVERAGGTIRFESSEKQGTTFYVKLPVRSHHHNKGDSHDR